MIGNEKHQYHVYNDFINLVITSPIKDDDYATTLGKRVAFDYYSMEDEYLQNIKCAYICSFHIESVVNLNLLSK